MPILDRMFRAFDVYYGKLLGDEAEKPQKGGFRVGQSELVLGSGSGGEYFRRGVAGFDPSARARKLKNLGVAVDVLRDRNAVTFRDRESRFWLRIRASAFVEDFNAARPPAGGRGG